MLPADTPARAHAQALWQALAAHGAVLPLVLGDRPPPPARAVARAAGAVFLSPRLPRVLLRLRALRPALVVLADAPPEDWAAELRVLGCPVLPVPAGAALPDAAALRSLGLSVGAPRGALVPSPHGAILKERAGFNPHTRLLWWRVTLRLAVPATPAARWLARGGAPPPNAFVSLLPGASGTWMLQADAVLPPGLPPEAMALHLEAPGVPPLLRRPPRPLPVETAGLLTLEATPDGGAAVRAWADDPRTTLFPPAPLHGAAPGLLRACLPGAGDDRPLRLLPGRGMAPALSHPAHWLLPRRPGTTRLAELRSRHVGETAWLVGNGPSVRPADLDALAGRLTFAFNRFHLAHDRTALRPTYTVSGDRQMIEDFGARIVAESGGTVFLADAVPPPLAGDYIWLRQLATDPPLFSLSPEQRVSPGGSSVFVALQLAHFMGVRRCNLYGADFRFDFAPAPASADPFRSATGEGNHFIPGYRDGRPWCPPSLRDIAGGFGIARRVMEAEGGFLRNSTRGGLLEMLPRVAFETALAEDLRT
ncbi:hypothetical protein [Roseomonas haemaphysalidis]|uniref:DUF115 domain-containing protein n=1 Tax=Roseomonas haemaphysalidis TaxID=2768162 RepID=A0ABS3KSM4_9PROT|nr:hypothetical protein [Roseomonas haemaphysalidis]MBO1080470.1 hypothetical protein [Roseomonas haemaphysalidis]